VSDQVAPAVTSLVAVVGATATGKSDLAVRLAQALAADVVNADAMQLYRGMDIGTAKLPLAERRGVRHHLLDILEVTEEASVAAYQRAASAVVDRAAAGCRCSVLAGGSGLYVSALVDRLQIPPTDPTVRARLEAELAVFGAGALHRRLAGADPVAAGRILPSNARRVVRALEVIELTGQPFQAAIPPAVERPGCTLIGLHAPRQLLDRRIADRVDAMWAAGLVDETRRLLDRGLASGRTASRALGYTQVLRYLAGDCTEQQARADTVQATRRFARRQESWFRRDQRITWLPADVPDLLDRALAAVHGDRRCPTVPPA
jgi:tRNA dimethylallyltransferase